MKGREFHINIEPEIQFFHFTIILYKIGYNATNAQNTVCQFLSLQFFPLLTKILLSFFHDFVFSLRERERDCYPFSLGSLFFYFPSHPPSVVAQYLLIDQRSEAPIWENMKVVEKGRDVCIKEGERKGGRFNKKA